MTAPPSATRARWQATLSALVAVVVWAIWRSPVAAALALVLALLAGLAWGAPRTYRPMQRLLDAGARKLSAGVTWLILGALFAGVFVPMRGLWWLLRRDPLRRGYDAAAGTYLEPLPEARADRFHRQF